VGSVSEGADTDSSASGSEIGASSSVLAFAGAVTVKDSKRNPFANLFAAAFGQIDEPHACNPYQNRVSIGRRLPAWNESLMISPPNEAGNRPMASNVKSTRSRSKGG